ncbi:hypothetical protein CBR_g20314 [Chara braunii]|uniref:Pectinesterase n=1 Tax=Chara braunii TaxID=69332 RepID=A0A388L055_CHABU|nr:hypothetical protein CBR_g20314 [Chara braunii]|eukprot:GBG75689.1 hypothetical protein CBR_g20314 [Chara braunii]
MAGNANIDHIPLQGDGVPRRKSGRKAVKICLISMVVACAVAILIAVPITYGRRNRHHNRNGNTQNMAMTSGEAVELLCDNADDQELCKQSLMVDENGNNLNASASIDTRTLAAFPMRLLNASSSQVAAVNRAIDDIVVRAQNTSWERAARACNDSFADALLMLVDIANATAQEDYNTAKAGLAALRTETADCAEELFKALNLSYEPYNSSDSMNVTFLSVEHQFSVSMGATLYNSTLTLAFQLSNAMNVITNIKDKIKGGRMLLGGVRRLSRRRLLAQADVDRRMEPRFTVDPRGGADFKKIQQAINAAFQMRTEGATERIVIKIKAGLYREKVLVPRELWKLTIIGDGPDRTTVQWGDYTNPQNTTGLRTRETYTFAVEAVGFLALDMTFENNAGWSATVQQAVALRASLRTLRAAPQELGSGLAAFSNCHFLGHQDTLYSHTGWQFYDKCVINGTVDYIFGNAAAVFQKCALNSIRTNGTNTITAQSRTSEKEETGFVFRYCEVDRNSKNQTIFMGANHPNRLVYLGRPWRPYSRVVFMFCYIGGIHPEGWSVWTTMGRGSDNHETAEYYEYRNDGPGARTESRVPWSRVLPADEAGDYTVAKFIHGRTWLPRLGISQDMWV